MWALEDKNFIGGNLFYIRICSRKTRLSTPGCLST
jgi:hypothetical protein